MKLKKIGLGMLTGLLLVGLSGCFNDPRKEFLGALSEAGDSAAEAAKFEMTLEDFNYSDNSASRADRAFMKRFTKRMGDASVTGSFASDEENETFEAEFTFDMFDMEIPLQLVSSKENMYISTSFIAEVLDLFQEMDYPITINEDELDKLDGKFVDIDNVKTQFDGDDKEEDDDKNTKDTKEDKGINLGLIKKTKELLDIFDKKDFTKDGDKITHTFTKDEIIKVMEKLKEFAEEDNDTASEKSLKDNIKTIKNTFDDLSVKATINTKNNHIASVITLSRVAGKAEMDLKMKLDITPQKNTGKIKVPSKKDILSERAFDKAIQAILTPKVEINETDDLYDSIYGETTKEEMSAYLDELIKDIEAYPEDYTKDDADYLRTYGPLWFDEKQMERLNNALDAALL